jgi:hypothetical protein
MRNLNPEIKASHKILMLISQIERLTGRRELHSKLLDEPKFTEAAIQNTYLATLCLDQTTPAQLTHPLLSFFKSTKDLNFNIGNVLTEETLKQSQACKECYSEDLEFGEKDLCALYLKLTGMPIEVDNEDIFRKTISSFISHDSQRLFTTVSPFLVRRRLEELIEWVTDELYCGDIHPIIVAGTYHLLFLQLHPFQTANHRVALVSTWHLLKNTGYNFIKESDLIGIFLRDEKDYYASLKQAERSTFTDWTTMNVWLEFFAAKLLECASTCFSTEEKTATFGALTPVQKKILEIIKREGAVSREKVVFETGISSSTIKYNLSQLAERGHLKREGNGRSTNYRLF